MIVGVRYVKCCTMSGGKREGAVPLWEKGGSRATVGKGREPCHSGEREGALPLWGKGGSPATVGKGREPCHCGEREEALPLWGKGGSPATVRKGREPCHCGEMEGALPLHSHVAVCHSLSCLAILMSNVPGVLPGVLM